MNDDLPEAARRAFPDCYVAARARFLALAPQARAYPSPATGPAGEALFTDAAWFGAADARKLLVTVSAFHGVEGYCGSACQLDWIAQGGPASLGADEAVLVVHAINPYGYAWDRRVTEEGCDLNRNFVDFDALLPHNDAYDALAARLKELLAQLQPQVRVVGHFNGLGCVVLRCAGDQVFGET